MKGLIILFSLYLIQGLSLGFGQSLELILKEKGLSLSKLAYLSFTKYPFIFKFLFAPYVDFNYVKRIGRRKS